MDNLINRIASVLIAGILFVSPTCEAKQTLYEVKNEDSPIDTKKEEKEKVSIKKKNIFGKEATHKSKYLKTIFGGTLIASGGLLLAYILCKQPKSLSSLLALLGLASVILGSKATKGKNKVPIEKVKAAPINLIKDKYIQQINSTAEANNRHIRFEPWHTLEHDSSYIDRVVFSPCSNYIASASSDKTVQIWSVKKGTSLKVFDHTGWVRSVVFSPCGKYIAFASSDKTLQIWDWDAKKGTSPKVLRGHTGFVFSVVFSPCGNYIASASSDKTVQIWDWDAKKDTSKVLRGHTGSVGNVVFSPCGNYIASASGDKTVRVWDAKKGKYIHTLKGHTSYVSSVVFSPCGKYIVSTSDDKTLRIWNAKRGTSFKVLRGHIGRIIRLVFSPCSRYIAVISDDTVRRRRKLNGHLLDARKELRSNEVICLTPYPPYAYISSVSGRHTVRIWKLFGPRVSSSPFEKNTKDIFDKTKVFGDLRLNFKK